MSRNLSINAYFRHRAARHTPRLRYAGQKFQSWQRELVAELRALLGKPPHRVPLNPELQAEWTDEGVVKQRILFDVEDGLSAVAYLFRPESYRGEKIPGILACHGHGPFGKESVMGNRSSAPTVTDIVNHNYDYGLQMAQAGFAVIAIDWRGFGERDDRRKPHFHDVDSQHPHKRDLCDLHYLRATVLGQTVLGMDVHDGSCAIDLLCQQPYVDANRIGVMGLSFGGAMSTWMSICDERIKATDIICYSDRFADFGMRDVNFCGSQIVPGLYDLCDVPDLHGAIAPRPLLVEIGAFDECFKIDSAMSCWREVEKIYTAAGARENLELDLFEGGHRWGGNKSLSFFRKHLGGSTIADDGRVIEVTTAAAKRSSRAILREIATDAAPFGVGGGGGSNSTPAGDGDGAPDRQG